MQIISWLLIKKFFLKHVILENKIFFKITNYKNAKTFFTKTPLLWFNSYKTLGLWTPLNVIDRKQLQTRILTPTLGRLTRSLAAPRQSRPRVGVKILVCRYFLPINHSALPRGLLAITYWSFISPMVYILIIQCYCWSLISNYCGDIGANSNHYWPL